jgi:voltage-gated potassium channel
LLIYNSTVHFERDFEYIEDLILQIFIIEYVLRLWVYNNTHEIILNHYNKSLFTKKRINYFFLFKDIIWKKIEYMKTPLAIIDLLAILPNFRAFRFLRIFLIFRLFKIFRYTKSIKEFLSVLEEKKFELFALFVLFGFVILISSVAMYIFEVRHNNNVNNFFDAVYWSYVTIASLGYGDISPTSSEGRVVTLFLILAGIAFMSFATSIITSAFSEKLMELKEDKLKNKVEKFEENNIITAYNLIGIRLYHEFKNIGKSAVIICKNYQESKEAASQNIIAIYGDPSNQNFLKSIGINRNVKRVLAISEKEIENLNTILTVRSLNPDIEIISLINSFSSLKKFQLAGVTKTLYPYYIFSKMVTMYIQSPKIFQTVKKVMFGNSDIFIDEVLVKKNKFLLGKKISEIDFKKFKILIFGVVKSNGNFIFKPNKDFQFEIDDKIIIFGNIVSLSFFSK